MTPKPPPQKEPVRIPTADDPDIKAAARAKTEEDFAARRGRQSTNLSGSYNRTTLG